MISKFISEFQFTFFTDIFIDNLTCFYCYRKFNTLVTSFSMFGFCPYVFYYIII